MWTSIDPEGRYRLLRRRVTRGIRYVYLENGRRYDPCELKDTPKSFGVTVSENVAGVLTEDLAELENAHVVRPSGSLAIVLDNGYTLYVYKAPPGALSIRDLRINESSSDTKLDLIKRNGRQMSLFGHGQDDDQQSAHLLVIVHLGGPEHGLDRIEIGLPFENEAGICEWAWVDRFDLDDPVDEGWRPNNDLPLEPPDDDQAGGFGLQLRDDVPIERDAEQ